MVEPYLLRGGDHACLLVHGFAGDPGEMRDLGRHLAAAGHTVLGLRLPGHTGRPEDLAAVRWGDWLAAVRDGYDALAARQRRVSLIGFSLGGALAAALAAQRPLASLTMLATPYRLQGDWRAGLLGVARHVVPWFYLLERADFSSADVRATVLRHQPDLDLDDPAVQAVIRRSVRVSVAAVDELRHALAVARLALPAVRAPALIMHGRADTTADPAGAATIAAQIGSPRRELVYWEATGHQLLIAGPHRAEIFARISTFLAHA